MRAALAEVDARVAAAPLAPAGEEVFVRARACNHLEEGWRDLAADAAEPNSYAESWFAGPALRHLADGVEVRLLEVWLRGTGEPLPIGLMPVCVGTGYGRMTVRHLQNWKHFHSFLGVPLVRRGHEQRFWTAILAHLDAARWAPGFFHVNGLVEDGPVHAALRAAAEAAGKPSPTVHREIRAALASDLSPEAYYERNVRKKKRKEIQRLTNRLGELGRVETRRLGHAGEIEPWCDAFLALERAGWKGRAGSALACGPKTEAFFREVIHGAFEAGKLDFLRIDLDGKPIAMLVNFLAPPGSFSFKIAFDEDYARFSPGVLIQRENLAILSRGDIAWMDSCAAENHPMIDSLWGERRSIVRVTVPLSGLRRRLTYAACRTLENAGALRRRLLHG